MKKCENNRDEIDTVIAGLNIFKKLLSNIVEKPNEEKFRKINRQNKTVKAKLLSIQPQLALFEMIETLGFIDINEDDSFVFVGDDFTAL